MADYSNPETKALYERYMSQGLEQGLSAPAASAIAQRTVEGTLGQLRPGGTQASVWGSGQDQSEARNAALARVAQEAPSSGGFFDQFAKETVRPAPVRRAVARRRVAPRGMDMGFLNNTEADNLELMEMAQRDARIREEARSRSAPGRQSRYDRIASQIYGSTPDDAFERALMGPRTMGPRENVDTSTPSQVYGTAPSDSLERAIMGVPPDIDISTQSPLYGQVPPPFLYSTREASMRRPVRVERVRARTRGGVPPDIDISTPSQVYGSAPSPSFLYATREARMQRPETLEVPPTPPLSPRAYVRSNTPDENALLMRMAERDASPSPYVRSNTRAENDALMVMARNNPYVRSMGIDELGALMEAGAFPQRNTPQMSLDLMDRARRDARSRRIAQRIYDETEYRKFLEGSQAAAGRGLSGEAEYEQFLADSLAADGGSPLTSGQQMSRDLFRSMRPGIGRF